MTAETRSPWREQLARVRQVAAFDRFQAYVGRLSIGDRVLLYALVGIACIVSLVSAFALEQSLLERVPAYGGTLVEGALGNPQFINPLLAISDADRDLSALTYSGLMRVSGDGTLVPSLAERYSVSGDGKSYTFVLRKDARFSDGTPVTADDVVFTVKKAQDPALKSPEYADWSGVNVVAIDARTVRFTLARAYAPFLGLTTLGILPSRLWQSVSDAEFPFSTLETSPVGTGPFRVSRVSRDASGLIASVTLSANPYYVSGRPYLDGIRFDFYANADDLSQALSNGAVDSAYGVRSGNALTAPYARVFGVFFNPSQTPAYARAEVRKALSLAIDRRNIVSGVLGGNAAPIMGPVPPGGGIAQATVPEASSPSDSAKMLEAGGWAYDPAARAWSNAKAKLTLGSITIRTSNVPELKNVASAVKQDWERLGIAVDIELYEPGDLSQNVIRLRKYDTLLYGMVIGRDQDLYAFWDSQEQNDPGLNIALYANKTVDALLEEARSTADDKTRRADMQKIEDTVAGDYPAAFIYSPDFVYSIPQSLRGVRLPQIITPADRFANVADWYLYTDSVWPFFATGGRAG